MCTKMSVAFATRGNRPPPSPAYIQKLLDENCHLIQTIQDYQSKGQANECMQYQQVLHRNLVYLASIADSSQNIQALLPPPHQLQSGNVPPGSGIPPSTSAEPNNPQGVAPASTYSQPQQNYRPPLNVTSPNTTRPTQSYNQRPYPQSQYQGQYQNMPSGNYPPQGQGYMGGGQQSYGPPGSQPQGYPPGSSYGPPITTAPNTNYPPTSHQGSNYPPSTQQPYVPPPSVGPSSASAGPYPGSRGNVSQGAYTGSSNYQPPPMGSNYGNSANVNSNTYNANPPQPQSYQSQQFPNNTPTSGYSSAPTTQSNHSPQPSVGYANQPTTGANSYGPPSAQSPTYTSNSHNPNSQSNAAPPPSSNTPSVQQYPPPGQSAYPPVSQPPFSNPSSQPGSPAPSNYQTANTQPPSNNGTTQAQGYAPANPQSYPPPAGSYPHGGYSTHPQQGYPPAQYPGGPYQYSRPPAPGPPPPQANYAGYGFQPPAQQ